MILVGNCSSRVSCYNRSFCRPALSTIMLILSGEDVEKTLLTLIERKIVVSPSTNHFEARSGPQNV